MQDPLGASTEAAMENLNQYGAAILEDCVSQESVDLCREHILGEAACRSDQCMNGM